MDQLDADGKGGVRESYIGLDITKLNMACVEIITGLPYARIVDSIRQHCQKPMVSMVTVKQINQVGFVGKCCLFIHG